MHFLKIGACWLLLAGLWVSFVASTYPIDGYESTGIRRLNRLQLIMDGKIKDVSPIAGAQKSIKEIKLNLIGPRGEALGHLPEADPALQAQLNRLFPNLSESYSVSLLDITPGRAPRYASRQENRGFQPGSVGKLAVLVGLFAELKKRYPQSFEKRQELLRTHMVQAGDWALPNEHTVPFFDPATQKFFKRTVQAQDVFSLYEWTDHMLSVSSNAAASIVWREVILMRAFGQKYPVSQQEADQYFATTPKAQLTEIGIAVVNEPLRALGITEEEWRLGSLFTRGGKARVPGSGGSTGSPRGLMKFLLAMERGKAVDPASSLEMKRLMYLTDRRIRYAASTTLTQAAVYFKSGSLYSCRPEEGYACGKYRGNASNYMNSVAIVEQPDGTTYLVTLMSNVLKKNSANDHFALASQIDKLLRP